MTRESKSKAREGVLALAMWRQVVNAGATTPEEVEQRKELFDLRKAELVERMRPCLKCRKPFMTRRSRRICGECTDLNEARRYATDRITERRVGE